MFAVSFAFVLVAIAKLAGLTMSMFCPCSTVFAVSLGFFLSAIAKFTVLFAKQFTDRQNGVRQLHLLIANWVIAKSYLGTPSGTSFGEMPDRHSVPG